MRMYLPIPPKKRRNQCRKCVFLHSFPFYPTRNHFVKPPVWLKRQRTWNEFVIIIMGLHATRITNNKRMLSGCILCVCVNVFLLHGGGRQLKTKNGSASLNSTNNIKQFYNVRLHAIFKAIRANGFMSLT